MSKKRLILVGAGGHCRSCIDVIEQEDLFEIIGIVDRVCPDGAVDVLGYPIIGSDEELPALKHECDHALVSVGQIKSSDIRIRLFSRLKDIGFELPSIVSPLAYISPHAKVGEGTIAMHRVVVNANARIGDNCILNTGCLVEHDAVVGNHVHISTGAVINGESGVGDQSFVGSSATVIQGVMLPSNSFIRASRLVVSSERPGNRDISNE